MKNIEGLKDTQPPEKTPPPYDAKRWFDMQSEALFKGGLLDVLEEGREMGVPEEELNQLADRVIANAERLAEEDARGLHLQNAFILRSRLGRGTPAELIELGERALQKLREEDNDRSAAANEIREALKRIRTVKEVREKQGKSAA